MRVALFFIFIGLIAISCQKQKVQGKRYFDLDSLVNAQILYLSKTKASLKKEVIFTEKSSASTNILDSAAWSHELDVFRQLDLINRPIYFDAYQVKDGIKDSKSNLLVRSYEADGKSPVPYLRLFYQGTPSKIKKLEALYLETNSLYSSQRKLEMYFDDAPGNPSLTGFFIDGEQKMIMSDSVHYTIRTEIQ